MTSELVERWPGYTQQSWQERFQELDRQRDEASKNTMAMVLSFSAKIASLTAQLAEARQAERAAVERCVKLWALLDDIDTLDDVCRGDDDLFRSLARAAQQKRHAIMSGEEWDAARKNGEPA